MKAAVKEDILKVLKNKLKNTDSKELKDSLNAKIKALESGKAILK